MTFDKEKEYKLFISHCWDYRAAYYVVENWINESDIKNFCDIFFINEINQKNLKTEELERLNYYKKLLLMRMNFVSHS